MSPLHTSHPIVSVPQETADCLSPKELYSIESSLSEEHLWWVNYPLLSEKLIEETTDQ